MTPTKGTVGVRQRLQAAKSVEELDAIMSETLSFDEASPKTKRAWRSTYNRVAKKLETKASK